MKNEGKRKINEKKAELNIDYLDFIFYLYTLDIIFYNTV